MRGVIQILAISFCLALMSCSLGEQKNCGSINPLNCGDRKEDKEAPVVEEAPVALRVHPEARAALTSDHTNMNSVPRGTEVSFDASDSVFDDLYWYVGDIPISDCRNLDTCIIGADIAGTYTIRIVSNIHLVEHLSEFHNTLVLEDTASLDLVID